MLLLACDADRMTFKIPKDCQGKKPEHCIHKLGASLDIAQMFQQNAHNAYAICLFHIHMEMEEQHDKRINDSIELADKDRDVTKALLQKTKDLAAIQDKRTVILEQTMTSLTEKIDQQLKGLGQRVASESGQILHAVNEMGRQANETIGVIKDSHKEIIDEVKSKGWGSKWFWPVIEMLETRTGWSQAYIATAIVVAISASIVTWCFELNKKQKLLVLVVIAAISSGVSNTQTIEALVVHYLVMIYITAAICITVVIVLYFVVARRPYKRQFPPTDFVRKYYGDKYCKQ